MTFNTMNSTSHIPYHTVYYHAIPRHTIRYLDALGVAEVEVTANIPSGLWGQPFKVSENSDLAGGLHERGEKRQDGREGLESVRLSYGTESHFHKCHVRPIAVLYVGRLGTIKPCILLLTTTHACGNGFVMYVTTGKMNTYRAAETTATLKKIRRSISRYHETRQK